MSLARGRPYLAIPGPSVMPDRVLAAMQRPAPNIYAGALVEMVAGLVPDLKAVARTDGNVAIYIANGHGVWEAALANTVMAGDRVLALGTGHFGPGWAHVAKRLGAVPEMLDFGKRRQADPAQVETRLRADRAGEIRALLVTHADTATGVVNDIPAIRAAMDAAGHPALLMVDSVAGLACDPYDMDRWGVDVTVAASQKGLMTPPGLGFVYFSDRAAAARDRVKCASPYWDWRPRTTPEEFYRYFGGTAPTHHLYALREALTMLLHEEGLDAALLRHGRLARAVWAACDAWGRAGSLALNVPEPAHRSHAVTSVRIEAPHGTALRDWLERETGVTLGIGLGMAEPGDPAWHGFFRIAHMGHVNAHMVLGALAAVEAGLRALRIEHGAGALEAAAEVVAG